MSKGKLIVLVGPTGVGKTSLSIALSQRLKCPIISADSRQLYRELPIGTAMPTPLERSLATHYMVGTASIFDTYSVAQYEDEVINLLENRVFPTSQYALLSGGSMLYVDAIVKGLDEIPSIRSEIREELQKRWQEEGLVSLLSELKTIDLPYYNHVDHNNYKRVLHGLEVYYSSGAPLSSYWKGTPQKRSFDVIKILVERPREELWQRINLRTLQMFKDGWLAEAWALYPYRHLNALNTIGYKEIFALFSQGFDYDALNEAQSELWRKIGSNVLPAIQFQDLSPAARSLQQAIRLIQKKTRIYARQQMTWWKKHPDIIPFPANGDALDLIALLREKDLI